MKEVTAAIIIDNDNILIAQRGKIDLSSGNSLVRRLRKRESPEECLIREIKEEINVEIIIDEFHREKHIIGKRFARPLADYT